ncbi:MAG: OB-fold nucleic acid binding domain-containing protein [archaeon]
MKISELQAGQGNVDIEAEVVEVSAPREFNKFGRNLSVATATIKDDSGTVKMSLWNQDIDKVKAGSRIKVTSGYVNEFQGEKQFTSGKFGKIEVLGEGKSIQAEEKSENFEEERIG